MTTAEQRGYAKGYAAGRQKRGADAEQAFKDQAFLAVLPWVFQQGTWGTTVGGRHTPYTTVDERVNLAWSIARSATKQR